MGWPRGPRSRPWGVRGAVLFGVVRGHLGEVEPVEFGLAHRHADDAAGVTDHEGEELGGGQAGGEDDVALVLPVLVVHDQHRAARRDVLDRAVDVVEQLIHLSPSGMSIRSTYLAITSTSRFTTSPGCLVPSVVRLS